MKRLLLLLVVVQALLSACQSGGSRETIAQLRNMKIETREEKIDGGLEKALNSYERFLHESPESSLTPVAMRRLADLKIEQEYGYLNGQGGSHGQVPEAGSDELERAGAREAIALYTRLLKEFPAYGNADQVLYQMTRAYEELGQTDDAMAVMDRLAREFPKSPYLDEVRFRRAEYFFTRRHYLDAEAAYKSILDTGAGSAFYELALYKLGWTLYKQELYEDALHRFIALLDAKVAAGYDFAQTKDDLERKRIDDTFRVISQSFSYLHGADSAIEFFTANGKRSYEDRIYSNLGEFYFEKRRYSDAAAAYSAFVKDNPFHQVSPQFHMRVIEIQMAGGFPSIVIDAKKQFATNYGLKAAYWQHFEPSSRPEVLGFLKTNLTDLAHHYHSLYQDQEQAAAKGAHFQEALHWYEEYLASFPQDVETAAVNYQLADLLLENRSYARAAQEYARTAYEYPSHEKSAAAGYAAVYAYREQLRLAPAEEKDRVKRETIASSLQFAETFPTHEKAAIVLGAAADDLYDMKDYEPALAAASKLLIAFPDADKDVVKSAVIVVGHANYELQRYVEAEGAYARVLALLAQDDPARAGLTDNLAASIYKQGEQAAARQDFRAAADHYLRIGNLAATSKIRANAEYDGAAALIELKDWENAATVLTRFRELFPGHELQPEVTRKIARVYQEEGKLALAAAEYERVEREFSDEEVRRGALVLAADLYEQAGSNRQALVVCRRFAESFPQPVEANLEMRTRIAGILKGENDQKGYLKELEDLVAIEGAAGQERTPRTRYLAGKGALVLAQQMYDRFMEVRLVQPFDQNLARKKELMKASTQAFNKLVEYQVGEVTAAATYYLAEIYGRFSKALTESERPDSLNAQELQEYELAIEEQAYPFEERAITVHERNLELISIGIYNPWIDKSLERLAKLVPVRYDKPEIASDLIPDMDTYSFEIEHPAPPAAPPAAQEANAAEPTPAAAVDQAVIVPAAEQPSPASPEKTEDKAQPAAAPVAQVEKAVSQTAATSKQAAAHPKHAKAASKKAANPQRKGKKHEKDSKK